MGFEMDKGNWRSYTLEESLDLDRYWNVYDGNMAGPYLAKVRLHKKEAIVDFVAMTCQVGESRPRTIQRGLKEAGWLSNSYFFDAFKTAMQRSGAALECEAQDMFNFKFNQDFTNMKDDGRKTLRGGKEYVLPMGWRRFAVHVRGKYDDGDNGWLKEDDSGWCVAYHGTAEDSLPGILGTGFRVGARQKFEEDTGSGIYCTPNITVAQHYSKPSELRGHFVQIVLQLRVRPSAVKPVIKDTATDFEKKYWVINDPHDIRAYGVLIRELALKDYVPPEVMVFGKDHPLAKKAIADALASK
eukprot:NODE_11492_length_1283_cov_6.590830.p1 GENE.NODE_11492_length_1283_cov_6.590830~~NODE_11492_length_1283_cov_6.590830.p1  ORF type:complete len:299 (+),score=76.98 NODE_11492_length_1283_cov_6.590830:90-986(+)